MQKIPRASLLCALVFFLGTTGVQAQTTCSRVIVQGVCRWDQPDCHFSTPLSDVRAAILRGDRRQDYRRVPETVGFSCAAYRERVAWTVATYRQVVFVDPVRPPEEDYVPVIWQCCEDDPCGCGEEQS